MAGESTEWKAKGKVGRGKTSLNPHILTVLKKAAGGEIFAFSPRPPDVTDFGPLTFI